MVLELALDGVMVSVCMGDKFNRGSSEPREASSAACGGDKEHDEILTLPGAADKAGQMGAMVRQQRQTSSSLPPPGPRAALLYIIQI